MAYDRLEPFGEERADLRNAMLIHWMVQLLGNGEHDFEIEDFMPKFYESEGEGEAMDLEQKARVIFGILR